jgi:tetratricopeptide (TPR) repeat protein
MRGQVRDRLASLMRMELVRPDQASFAGDEAYRFRHLLIRDAAYQALAKQTRSELHERFAAWLERVAAERLSEYEEIIGYHLEQAYRYRAELGPPDAHAQELAVRAGTLLADAGERADKRADAAATVDLLTRAMDLLPRDLPRRRRLLIRLGDRTFETGDGPRAEMLLTEAMTDADRAGDAGTSALAALVLLAVRSSTHSTEMLESLTEAERLGGVLARVGDEASARLAEAMASFLLFAMGRAGEALGRTAALVALGPGQEQWQREARMVRGASSVWGPVPAEEGIAVLQAQMDESVGDLWYRGANVGISRLLMFQGRFDEASERNAAARAVFEDVGSQMRVIDTVVGEGEIERLRGRPDLAVPLIRQGYDLMTATGDRAFASTLAVSLADALLDVGDEAEALRFATISRETSSSDDVMSQAGGRAIQARAISRRGDHSAAEAIAREAEAIMATTDYLSVHGDVLVHLAHVLREAGKLDEALAAARQAVALYEQKGATFFVERTQRLIEEWTS